MGNKGAGRWRLEWRGPLLQKELEHAASKALTEIGLRIEAEAKQELYPGHGKVTGTLQRSIHVAPLGYPWASDRTQASQNTPELGGQDVEPVKDGTVLWVEVGSGLEYAMAVHQGHRTFAGYHYITKAVEAVKPRVAGILQSAARAYARGRL